MQILIKTLKLAEYLKEALISKSNKQKFFNNLKR